MSVSEIYGAKTTKQLDLILDAAITDDDIVMVSIIAKRKLCNKAMIHKIIQYDSSNVTHINVAKNQNISLQTQQLLFDNHFNDYSLNSPIFVLAENPKLHPNIVNQLAETHNYKLLSTTLENHITPDLANYIFEKMFIKKTLPKYPKIVNKIAVENGLRLDYINVLVNTPLSKIYDGTKEEKEEYVFLGFLTKNHSLTPQHLTQIANKYINNKTYPNEYDKGDYETLLVLDRVAASENCTTALFEQLAKKGHPDIWDSLIKNPSTPTFCLQIILNYYEDVNIHGFETLNKLIQHTNTTTEMLKVVADASKNKILIDNTLKQMYSRGVLEDWPQEWLEERYGIKLDAKWIQKVRTQNEQ